MKTLSNKPFFTLFLLILSIAVFGQNPGTNPPDSGDKNKNPRTLGTIINNGDGNQEILEICLDYPYEYSFITEVRLANLDNTMNEYDNTVGVLPADMPPMFLTVLENNDVVARVELKEFALYNDDEGNSYYRVFYTHTSNLSDDCKGGAGDEVNMSYRAVLEMPKNGTYVPYPVCQYSDVFTCELYPGPWCDSAVISGFGFDDDEPDNPYGEVCNPLLFQSREVIRFLCSCKIDAHEDVDARSIPVANTERAFPNPTLGMVYVVDAESNRFSVLDNTGKLLNVTVKKGPDGYMQADLSDLPNGIYFIKIQANDSTISVERVMKM